MAVLSSDALSSVAYATEELLLVLVLAGPMAVHYSLPIGLAISSLIAIVILSYHQVVKVYSSGGGTYLVAKENLGVPFGLMAAAGLLVDYVLTVAVSVAAGVAALTAAFPKLHSEGILIGLSFIVFLTILNLRGVRQSGKFLFLPVYGFIFSFVLMIGVGVWRYLVNGEPAVPVSGTLPAAVHGLTLFLLLRAFSSGSTALTGIEAISNAVQTMKPPEASNARKTLLLLGVISVSLFVGITFLSYKFAIIPQEGKTVVSQVAQAAFGNGFGFYIIQIFTALILLLAANTAYADFPRVCSNLGRDSYLPRQLANLGDRLVYSNGIIALGVIAGLLLTVFSGSVHKLIPLYAIGVFICFSLNQAGMVRHWYRVREKGWEIGLVINGIGAVVTTTVFMIILVTKFTSGGWLIMVAIPILMMGFLGIKSHYTEVSLELSLDSPGESFEPHDHRVIIPIGAVHRAVIPAVRYAKSISKDVTAVYVASDPEAAGRLRERWERIGAGIPLVVIHSPYRVVVKPLIEYIDAASHSTEDSLVTVVLPEFIPHQWWQHILHNQTALFIKAALLFKRKVVVTSVPFHLRK
ncbi:MAG: APC family permease [Dehalococcoidia bacterium]|nr:APC family permease [Dehalococcoidia bacterium]